MDSHDLRHAEVAEGIGDEEGEAARGGGAEECNGFVFCETNGAGTHNVKSTRNETNRDKNTSRARMAVVKRVWVGLRMLTHCISVWSR